MARPFRFGTLSFKKRGQTESDKCGRIRRVTDLFRLLIAPPSHLTESQKSMLSGEADLQRRRCTFGPRRFQQKVKTWLVCVSVSSAQRNSDWMDTRGPH